MVEVQLLPYHSHIKYKMFSTYFQLGLQHIADPTAYDHIVFIVALCAVYKLGEWKNVIILVTAFTIGHSLTLALAASNILNVPAPIIEFLIPLTIFLTAIFNVSMSETFHTTKIQLNYFLALLFGFIHGMGFSNYFRGLLGKEVDILAPLLAFNLGIEIGQLAIVACILVATYIALNVRQIKHREWNLFISGATAGIAIVLMISTKFW